MPRNKKGSSARGAKSGRGGGGRGGRSGQGTPRGRGRATPGLAYVPILREIASHTLADEARQTSQHDHLYLNSNLRQRPIAFVSAGPSEPLKLLDELLEADGSASPGDETEPPTGTQAPDSTPNPHEMNEPNRSEVEDEAHDEEEEMEEDDEDQEDEELIGPEELEKAIKGIDAEELEQEAPTEKPTFFFDLEGDSAQATQTKTPVNIPERPSSRSSNSSDEVILFKGRDAYRKTQTSTGLSMTQMRTEIQVVEEQIIEERIVADFGKLSTQTRKSKRKTKKRASKPRPQSSEEDDAILADYIENMRENGDADDILANLVGNARDLGGTDYYVPDDSSSDDDAEGPGEHDDDDDEEDSASEVDDATLAKLLAGLEENEEVNSGDSPSSSSSSEDEKKAPQQVDANDEFDFMDWERPSLRRKKKGKGVHAQINFNQSDSEMERQLQAAWKNDRLKKSERKREREQQRALGLLGKKSDPEDLRVKYPDGMSVDQIADEFRSFLMGIDETIALPPMDNHARKMIHELATKFKIKSKSIGQADQRRPTLIRTLRTLPYVEATFDQAIARMSRRYFPRLDTKGKRSKRAPPPTRSNDQAASYRDGEIIGAAAPELGTENRGRAMLEKMGWSSGTALGAMNNKGIMQPVTQTMKRSKAGLG